MAVLRALRDSVVIGSSELAAVSRPLVGASAIAIARHTLRTPCRETGEMMLDENACDAKLPVAHYVASVLHGDVRARTRC